jgi:hypothetical protein
MSIPHRSFPILKALQKSFCGLGLLAALSFWAQPAHADPINLGLVNTGVNVNAAGVDQSYRLTLSHDPANPGPTVFAVQVLPPTGGNFWVPNQPTSRWIGPRLDESWGPGQAIGNQSAGTYIYETTFTVPNNADLSTARITGQLAVDNQLTGIILNGNRFDITTPLRGTDPEFLAYSQFNPFVLDHGFVLGGNVLDFIVENLVDTGGPNPTGIQIQMEGTVNPVPEPGTLTLAGLGISGVLGFCWKKRRTR